MGYQHTVIQGNVGREPEMRYTQSGVAVCDFSVAVNRTWTQDGQKREEVTWFKVSAWRALAEICNQYVRKGAPILVAGRVSVSAYVGQDGEARASLELTAQDVTLLGGRDEGEECGQHPMEPEDLPF